MTQQVTDSEDRVGILTMYSLPMIYIVELKFDDDVVKLITLLVSSTEETGHYLFMLQGWTVKDHHYTDILWHVKDMYGENIVRNGALEMNFFTMTTFLPTLLGLYMNFTVVLTQPLL